MRPPEHDSYMLARLREHYLIRFRPPLLIEQAAVCDICRHARIGYETPLKRETYGFLFGTLDRGGRLTIRRAVYYRGGTKTRSAVQFKDLPTFQRLVTRRLALSKRLRLRFAGCFHSHVEIAGKVQRGLSPEDRESFDSDFMSSIELVAFVWPGGGPPRSTSRTSVVAYDSCREYHFRVRAYAKRPSGIRQVPLKAIPPGLITLH
ncbi:MAG: hypothetical protein R6X13_07875 [bacterium]